MIDFLRYRFITGLTSLAIIAASIGMYFYNEHTRGSAFSYSIDFTGGTQAHLRFAQPVNAEQVKAVLDSQGWHGATIREFSSTEILVRVKEFVNDSKGLADRIRDSLQQALPDNQVTVLQSEAVGPGVGAELRWKAFLAVLIALFAIALYIAFTFWSFAFAMGAIVALAHDAIIMLAIFLFFDKDISITVIGAILAVLGYSINDTIVIFASIREHLKTSKGDSLYNIVNTSLNQTLRRTLLTSFATALTALALLLLGGEILQDFALTLLVGIIFGTYSSIYIASPVMMLLYKKDTKHA